MTGSRIAAVVFRFFFAGLALAALLAQLFLVTVAKDLGVVNFFSYFTILSNLFASIVFIVSAVRVLQGRESTTGEVAVRGASVVYMVFVGIVFNTLLRDADLGDLMPPWKVILQWMIAPVIYLAYSLIRGAITSFYAYPFFSPAASGGYAGVALYCVLMLVGFAIVAVAVRALGNLRARPLATH